MKKFLIYYLLITLSIIINSCSESYNEEYSSKVSIVLAEVTVVPSQTKDTTPDYVFNANVAGTITYGGSCSSSTTSAISGNNTITLASLSDGTYSDCTITVTNQKLDLKSSLKAIDRPPKKSNIKIVLNNLDIFIINLLAIS